MANAKVESGSTVPRRQLGREVRKLREEAGLTVGQAAEAIGRSAPTLWRIEKGGSPMRPGDVAGMCLIYGASPEVTDALVALAKETGSPGWWRSYTGAIPKWFDTFVGLEQSASHLRLYSAEIVPGLLQTERYADATFRAVRPSPSEEERAELVAVRMRRQRILTRKTPKPPRLEVVLGEAALFRPPRDTSAMSAQLSRLRAATELDNVTIRVLPLTTGLECAPDGRFHILDFPLERNGRRREPTVVYTDTLTGALYLEKPAEVKAYMEVWKGISDNTLSHADSLDIIKSATERYEQ
ncbi:MAG: helix-turn-helix domain-containing protein [Micromonosporaceae bacterium]|nr:helix-turn-helix domain-containing protein [Micromonosporaceae bacterium]